MNPTANDRIKVTLERLRLRGSYIEIARILENTLLATMAMAPGEADRIATALEQIATPHLSATVGTTQRLRP